MGKKGELNSNTVTVGDSNIPLTSADRSSRQKVNQETVASNDTLGQVDLLMSSELFTPK